jgi:ferrous iron transport protein B
MFFVREERKEERCMTLNDLTVGSTAVIKKVRGRGAFRKRIIEMGFVAGKEITVRKKAPLMDPIEYSIMGYNVSLRGSEASLIDVVACGTQDTEQHPYAGVQSTELRVCSEPDAGKIINIALVGNPNSGKTTLFNNLSGSHERVGNYAGVTVEAKESTFEHKGYTINITDLPGTYSITAYSPEELYVRSFIIDTAPDVVINVIDASNIERNLYLTTQLIDMDVRVIVALNMFDELEKSGDEFDYDALSTLLGIPIVPTVGSKGSGLLELMNKAVDVVEDRDETVRHIHINYGQEIEHSIQAIQKKINKPENACLTDMISSRYLSIKLIEKDKEAFKRLEACTNNDEIRKTAVDESLRIEKIYADDSETVITDAKYGFIAGALRETMKRGSKAGKKISEKIDAFLTHRYLSFPFFLGLMWLVFQGTFSLGGYPMDLLDSGVHALGGFIQNVMPEGSLKALIVDGVIGGVGGVIVFLPNLMILFFFISLMEDTGYMARAAFIMDRIMHRIGLHGRSFIPLIMGFGCNVPAVMATRTIESRNDRLVTILISPFMSCSARLPVYVLFIGAFFPSHSGTVLFSVYLIGIAVAAFSAVLLKKTFFRSKDIPFVMELPPYRMPTLRSTGKHMWDKAVQYLKKMGGVILVSSIIIWALGHYPRTIEFSKDYDGMLASIATQAVKDVEANKDNSAKLHAIETKRDADHKTLEREKESERQEKSYIGRIGKIVEPVIAPLGFDWRIGISIITGLAAKEIVVSSMGVLFNVDSESDEGMSALASKLKEQKATSGPRKGQNLFTPLVAFSFMIFILLYFPCIATVAAMKKETGSLKWPLFSLAYSTGAAWLVAFGVYQIGKMVM